MGKKRGSRNKSTGLSGRGLGNAKRARPPRKPAQAPVKVKTAK
jgi:hypothetical protein